MKKYLLESYEETYFSPKLEKAGKYSYVERNYEMIDSSTYCVFYYNENYVPPLSRQPNTMRYYYLNVIVAQKLHITTL